MDPFPYTESGDAEFFAAIFGDRVRFDHRQGRWLIFGKHCWLPDRDGERYRLALEAMRERQQAALEIGRNTKDRLENIAWAIEGESRRRQVNMLTLAENQIPIADFGENWDTDPWLLGVPNGVADLRTGALRDGRPEDRITMRTAVEFDPNAKCPVWEHLICDVFANDHDVVRYVQRALGYSLTGNCHEECFFMAEGNGRNGKGTIMNTFHDLLGDYAENLSFSALELHARAAGASPEIAKLHGKRYVTASETNTVRLNEARVKALTGRDPVTARFLYKNEFTFRPAAKFWLATNTKPIVGDTSVGFWSRVRLIPFRQSYAGKEDVTLKDKLVAEMTGILAWAVRGCLDWQQHGLPTPKAIQMATAEYELESDPLAAFIAHCCDSGQRCRVSGKELFVAYVAWANSVGETPISQTAFGKSIKQRFGPGEEHAGRITYVGIALRAAQAAA